MAPREPRSHLRGQTRDGERARRCRRCMCCLPLVAVTVSCPLPVTDVRCNDGSQQGRSLNSFRGAREV